MSTPKRTKTDRFPKDFESLLKELDEIVAKLETGEPGLEKSIELFEKGTALASEGMKRLDLAEKKVELLLGQDGLEQTVPFLPEHEQDD